MGRGGGERIMNDKGRGEGSGHVADDNFVCG